MLKRIKLLWSGLDKKKFRGKTRSLFWQGRFDIKSKSVFFFDKSSLISEQYEPKLGQKKCYFGIKRWLLGKVQGDKYMRDKVNIMNTLRWYRTLEQGENDLTIRTWQDNTECPININLVCTSDDRIATPQQCRAPPPTMRPVHPQLWWMGSKTWCG